jgi:hypothetical protein
MRAKARFNVAGAVLEGTAHHKVTTGTTLKPDAST